jgi:hypothetical protein
MCGVGIELAHIDRTKAATLDNAIPVCFDCHCTIGHYVDTHPRGKKYGIEELTRRRDQIYVEQTSPLVPPVDFRLTQQNHTLPGVGFHIRHLGAVHPVKVYVNVLLARGHKKYGHPQTVGHYDGRYGWNLNPRQMVSGWFNLRNGCQPMKGEPLRAKIDVAVVDIYDYRHNLYPVGYVLEAGADDWYAEPCEELM